MSDNLISHIKAFSTATFVFDIGVVELKRFTQAHFTKVNLRAVQKGQVIMLYHHLDPMIFEYCIRFWIDLISEVNHISPSRTARLSYA